MIHNYVTIFTWFACLISVYLSCFHKAIHSWYNIAWDGVAWFLRPLLLLLFYVNALFWHIISIYQSPSHQLSQQCRWHPRQPSYIRRYPRRWMTLICYLLLGSVSSLLLVATSPLPVLKHTWQRTYQLNDLLSLNSGNLLQYHSMSYASIFPVASLQSAGGDLDLGLQSDSKKELLIEYLHFFDNVTSLHELDAISYCPFIINWDWCLCYIWHLPS